MGRAPCCDKANVKRGPWSPEEDAALKTYLETYGTGGNWMALPGKAGLRRCGKSCRLRWLNYLRPDIKHGGFTEEEDNTIFTLYCQMGSRWSVIASKLPGRTDNDVKNYWNTKLKKKLWAGNVSDTTKSDHQISAENPTLVGSTPSLHCVSKAENHSFGISAFQAQNPADVGSGLSANSHSLNSDPIQLYCSGFMDVLEFGSSSKNICIVSQENSGFSNLQCLPVAGNHDEVEDSEVLEDFGFGSPYGVGNGLSCFQHKTSEAAPPCYPNLADLTYADMKPQGLDQSVIDQY